MRDEKSKTGAPFGNFATIAGAILLLSLLARARRNDAPSEIPAVGNPSRPAVASTRDNRGRGAKSPTQIPRKGWWDILVRVYEEFTSDRLMAVAAGVTFYTMLALFPGIAAFISLYGLLADPQTIGSHLSMLESLLPAEAINIVGGQLGSIAGESNKSLGFGFFIGLAIALWSASAGVRAIIDSLNIVYEEDEKRGYIKLYGLSLLFTFGAVLLGIITIGAVVAVPIILDLFGQGSTAETVLKWVRWPILYVFFVVSIGALYRYGPSRAHAKWRWVIWGALLGGLLWLAASGLFSWYVANFASYNETYGSLGAVIAFMTWIWISTVVILACAELNSEMEHQTVRDTTKEPTEPLGRRGAVMADTIGRAAG